MMIPRRVTFEGISMVLRMYTHRIPASGRIHSLAKPPPNAFQTSAPFLFLDINIIPIALDNSKKVLLFVGAGARTLPLKIQDSSV
jgi:hypothetical protein